MTPTGTAIAERVVNPYKVLHLFMLSFYSKIKIRLVQKGACMMEQANRILTVLEEAGHEAYIIGGAVRDILMHQKPHDFDIVTSARPDTVIEVLRGHDIQTTRPRRKIFWRSGRLH